MVAALALKATPGSRTVRAGRIVVRIRPRRRVERGSCGCASRRKLGPARIAGIVGMPASTVHRVLCRHGLNRLAWMDRPTGRVIRRIHTDRPGELVHVDVKKLGRIPPAAAGVRTAAATSRTRAQRVGYDYIHTASTPTAASRTARSSRREQP